MKSASKIDNLLERLNQMPYFTKNTVYLLAKDLSIKETTTDVYISRFLKRKDIFSLKRGLYISAVFFNQNKSDISYKFYLANIIRRPSYITSWAALEYYGLVTEATYPITCVTTKVGRTYKTKIGAFSYRSINRDLFSDFNLVKAKFDFYVASPAKALFDLLYFRTYQFRGLNLKDIEDLIEDLRIDFDEMDKNERDKFYKMLKRLYE